MDVTLRGIASITYWADDVAAAADWYTEFLGVEPIFTRPGPGGRVTYAKFGIGDHQAELAIADRAKARPARSPGRAARSCTGASTTWRAPSTVS